MNRNLFGVAEYVFGVGVIGSAWETWTLNEIGRVKFGYGTFGLLPPDDVFGH
jgi:hypothetical protein